MSTLPDNTPVIVDAASVPPAQSPSRQNGSPLTHEHNISAPEEQETPLIADLGVQQNIPAVETSSAESAPETSAPEDQDQMQIDTVEGAEESEEEVELGPDGLRLVRDCLEQLFGESRVGQVVCRLCE